MEVDLGPCQLPLKGPRVGRTWKVREEAGKTRRAFSGFEAEPGQTPHQSLFGRHRACANEALHANLAAGGGAAATGTRRRSHPGRDLGGSVAPWRSGTAPAARFLGTARPFHDGRHLKVCSKEVRARTISRNR